MNAPVTKRLDLPERPIEVEDLLPRMILARDVYDARGMLLVAENTTMNPAHVERLQRFQEVEPLGAIYIYLTEKPKDEDDQSA